MDHLSGRMAASFRIPPLSVKECQDHPVIQMRYAAVC